MAATASKRLKTTANGPVRDYLRALRSTVADEAPGARRLGGASAATSVVRDALRDLTRRG